MGVEHFVFVIRPADGLIVVVVRVVGGRCNETKETGVVGVSPTENDTSCRKTSQISPGRAGQGDLS